MTKSVVRVVFIAILAGTGAVVTSGRASAAQKPASAPAKADAFEYAQAAMKAGQFQVARRSLIQFIETSIGDARLATAKELLPETWNREAEQLVKASMEPEAATVLMDCVEHYKTGGNAEQARERARKYLQTGYAKAAKSKDFEKAVACADRYAEYFPETPLAPRAELRELRADWLADGVKQRIDPEVLYRRLERSIRAGVTAADLWRRKVTVEQIRRSFVRSLFDEGYYDMAVELLKEWEQPAAPAPPADEAIAGETPDADPPGAADDASTDAAAGDDAPNPDPPAARRRPAGPPAKARAPDPAQAARIAAERKELSELLTKTLIERANALLTFGNRFMLEEVLTEMQSHGPTAAHPKGKAAIGKVRAALAALLKGRPAPAGKPAQPRVIKFDKPLMGEVIWTDDGSGNAIEGTVQLGGAAGRADLRIGPGFVLEGGTLYSEEGTIDLQGEPGRPVIFRRVHVALDLGGAMVAKFAIFEDCTFSKAGGWFDYYSSHWTFTDSLLVRSNFGGLTGVDYGIQIRGCALLECKFPSRYLCGDPPGDAAGAYRDGWNAVEENGFQRCEMPPSFVWTTKRCSFTECKVSVAEVYRSTTPLEVLMAVPPGSQDFFRDLQVKTQRDAAGAVKYVNASAKGPIKRRKMPAWKFAKAVR